MKARFRRMVGCNPRVIVTPPAREGGLVVRGGILVGFRGVFLRN